MATVGEEATLKSFNESTIDNMDHQDNEDVFYSTGVRKFRQRLEEMYRVQEGEEQELRSLLTFMESKLNY